MIKIVFLDLDDTLLDFRRAEASALTGTLRQMGVEPTEAIVRRYSEINQRQWELLEEKKLTRDQVLLRRFDLLYEELGVERSSLETWKIYERLLAQGHDLIPGAEDLLTVVLSALGAGLGQLLIEPLDLSLGVGDLVQPGLVVLGHGLGARLKVPEVQASQLRIAVLGLVLLRGDGHADPGHGCQGFTLLYRVLGHAARRSADRAGLLLETIQKRHGEYSLSIEL